MSAMSKATITFNLTNRSVHTSVATVIYRRGILDVRKTNCHYSLSHFKPTSSMLRDDTRSRARFSVFLRTSRSGADKTLRMSITSSCTQNTPLHKKIKYVLNVTNAAKPNHAWRELISDQVLFYKYEYGFTATSSTETNNTDENYNSRQLHYISLTWIG